MDAELVAGTIIADRFRLDRELGQGGMGAVWAATHQITHKQVALKFMHSKSPEMTARFIREAQTASAVRHPNVVDIHDVLPLPDGTPLMVMEMLQGEALADRLARDGRLQPLEIAQIMIPVISAVGAAHAVGIIHRDLKPENIYLARFGQTITPKVLDFGIAKVLAQGIGASNSSNLTRTGSLLGTPYYMSPEQVYGEKDVDARADIWSIGVILYQALTGKRPFDGENFGQLLKAVTIGTFEPIEQSAPWVPPVVVQVVNAMLRERSTRLSDLGEVERALACCLPMATGSFPVMSSGSMPQLPNMQSSGGFSQSGGYPSSSYPSGGYPSAGYQSSGGFQVMPSAMTPSGGVHAAPVAPVIPSAPAMTPSPMVRSQTLLLGSSGEHPLPRRSVLPIIGGVVGALAIAVTIAFVALRNHSTTTTTEGSGLVSTPTEHSTAQTPSATAVATSTAAAHTTDVAATQSATPSAHTTTTATTPMVISSATPALSAGAHNNRHGGTGGLSTDVPF